MTPSTHGNGSRGALGIILGGIASIERRVMAAIVLVTLGVAGFVKLAEEVMEGETYAFDRRILVSLRNPLDLSDPIGPGWIEEAMRDLTALGGNAVLTLVTAAAVGFLVITRKRHAALAALVAIAGGLIVASLMKYGFQRPRPDLVPHATHVYTPSFPSSHSAMSAVVYVTLGMLLARTQADTRVKLYVMSIALALTLLVGISRVYLGVHWPTDVLGGWALGATWAVACWLVVAWLQRRGTVESPSDGDGY